MNENEIALLFAKRIMEKMDTALKLIYYNDEESNKKKFSLIKELASLTSELLDSNEVNQKMLEIAESSQINGDNIKNKFDTFKMIRNVINHFPIFSSWEEIYVSQHLLKWNNPNYSQIENYFQKEKEISYKIFLKENETWVEKININIKVPQLMKYNKIYLKDVISIDDTIWTFATIDYYLQFLGLNIEQPRYIISI